MDIKQAYNIVRTIIIIYFLLNDYRVLRKKKNLSHSILLKDVLCIISFNKFYSIKKNGK